MSFTSKNLQTTRRSGLSVLKGATLFFLGMSCVMFLTRAYLEITPQATNARQVIENIFLTLGGDPSAATGISLNGASGTAYFANKVGIGVGAEDPQYELDIQGNGQANFSGQQGKVIINNTHMTASTPELSLQSNGVDMVSLRHMPSGLARGVNLIGYTNQPMRFWTDDTQRMIIDAVGNVGIGTTGPNTMLQVDGTGTFNEVTFPGGSNLKQESTSPYNMHVVGGTFGSGDHGNIILTQDGSAKGGEVGIGTGSPSAKLHIHSTASNIPLLSVTKNSDSYFHIADDGNVFVGTGAPSGIGQGKFNIYNGGLVMASNNMPVGMRAMSFSNNPGYNGIQGFYLELPSWGVNRIIGPNKDLPGGTGGLAIATDNATPINMYTSGSKRMTITAAGNVGIGTTGPTEKLEVAGSVKTTGGLQIGKEGDNRCNTTGDVGKFVYYNRCQSNGLNSSIYEPTFAGCLGSGSSGVIKKIFLTGVSRDASGPCPMIAH